GPAIRSSFNRWRSRRRMRCSPRRNVRWHYCAKGLRRNLRKRLVSEARMKRVDLNCDLGEGTGHDAALMPLITSANIACGAHAGNLDTMIETVELAAQRKVAVGAHPGYFDLENFGRT